MGVDQAIFELLHRMGGKNPVVDQVIALSGTYLLYLSLLIVALVFGYRYYVKKDINPVALRKTALILCVAVISAVVIELVIQQVYLRPRPFVAYGLVPLIAHAADASFPSTHAIVSFAIAQSVFFTHRRIGASLFVIGGVLVLARVIAGLHHPSDILVGALMGVGSAFLARAVVDNISKKGVRLR